MPARPSSDHSTGVSGSASATPVAAVPLPAPNNSRTPSAIIPPADLNYIPLKNKDLIKYTVWSNDPKDMEIETWFSDDVGGTGLSGSYNIPGMKPVIVNREYEWNIKYLVMDKEGLFYLWIPEEALYVFCNKPSFEDVIEQVIYGGWRDSVKTEYMRGIKPWTSQ